MKRFIYIAAILALVFLAACGENTEEQPEASLPPVIVITPTPSPTPEPTPEPAPESLNPLSGLPLAEDKVTSRPLAIMINNRSIAQPQLGVSKADLLFEIPVEGGITRMLAIFQDVTDIGEIGSVRSARPYYIDIAQAFDAIYIHAGGSPAAYNLLSSRKIDRFDGVNGPGDKMFYRDKQRQKKMGYEHSMVTSSEKIAEYLPTLGYRLEHNEDYSEPLTFIETHEISGETAELVTIKFSSAKSTSFKFDTQQGVYLASQYKSEYKDGNTDEQLAFSNLIILKTAISVISGDSEGRLSVKLTGEGEGYLAIGGKHMPIKWSKQSESAPFVFKDGLDREITLRTGKTYVAIMSNSASAEFKGADE